MVNRINFIYWFVISPKWSLWTVVFESQMILFNEIDVIYGPQIYLTFSDVHDVKQSEKGIEFGIMRKTNGHYKDNFIFLLWNPIVDHQTRKSFISL